MLARQRNLRKFSHFHWNKTEFFVLRRNQSEPPRTVSVMCINVKVSIRNGNVCVFRPTFTFPFQRVSTIWLNVSRKFNVIKMQMTDFSFVLAWIRSKWMMQVNKCREYVMLFHMLMFFLITIIASISKEIQNPVFFLLKSFCDMQSKSIELGITFM